MRRTSHDKREYLRYFLIAVLVIFLISISLFLLLHWEKQRGMFPSQEIGRDSLTHKGTEYVLKENIETFLVIGLDKVVGQSVNDSYNNDQQADFLMLFIFDNDARTCSAVHVNRDTMAEVSVLGVAGNRVDTVTEQIALSHTYGNGRDVSCRNTADAVSELLMGMKVDHYISFSMDSVTVLNDLVGGVEVVVSDDFTGVDNTLVKGETVVLKGEQALRYVRTRYGLEDSSNSTRMKRQQQYIRSLYDQFMQCVEKDSEFVVDASLAMSDYIVSDRSVTQLQDLARKFSEYEFLEISNLEGEFVNGGQFVEFYADAESITEFVVNVFYQAQS